jgi:hypothetical protein
VQVFHFQEIVETIRLDEDTITYFKSLPEKNGTPYRFR